MKWNWGVAKEALQNLISVEKGDIIGKTLQKISNSAFEQSKQFVNAPGHSLKYT